MLTRVLCTSTLGTKASSSPRTLERSRPVQSPGERSPRIDQTLLVDGFRSVSFQSAEQLGGIR